MKGLELIDEVQELLARVDNKAESLVEEERILNKLSLCKDLKILISKALEKEKELLEVLDKK